MNDENVAKFAKVRSVAKKNEDEITVCVKCANFLNKDPHSARKDVWYNHMCMAAKRTRVVDPYDGKIRYAGTNDLGGEYLTNEKYLNCRDVNNGRCQYFKGSGSIQSRLLKARDLQK